MKTFNVNVGFADKSQKTLDKATEILGSTTKKIEGVASAVTSSVAGFTVASLAALVGVSPENTVAIKLIKLIRDIVAVYSTDGVAGTLAVATLIAESSENVAYTALLTGCVVFMKQFTQWSNQDLVEKKGAFDRVLDGTLLQPLVDLVSKFVFGFTQNISKINGLITFSKNFVNLGEFLTHSLQWAVNTVCEQVIGHKLWLDPWEEASLKMDLLEKNIVNWTRNTDALDHDGVLRLREHVVAYRSAMLDFVSNHGPKEKAQARISFLRILETFVGNIGVETEMVHPRSRPAVIGFRGRTGVGKTSITQVIVDALGTKRKWTGSPNQWLAAFKLAVDGFQTPLPLHCKALQIDEPFCLSDPAAVGLESLSFLLLVGNNPFQMEGAGLDHKNDYIAPEALFLNYNTMNRDKGVINPEAIERRPDFLFEMIKLCDDLYEEISYETLMNDTLITFEDDSKQRFSSLKWSALLTRKLRATRLELRTWKLLVLRFAPSSLLPTFPILRLRRVTFLSL